MLNFVECTLQSGLSTPVTDSALFSYRYPDGKTSRRRKIRRLAFSLGTALGGSQVRSSHIFLDYSPTFANIVFQRRAARRIVSLPLWTFYFPSWNLVGIRKLFTIPVFSLHCHYVLPPGRQALWTKTCSIREAAWSFLVPTNIQVFNSQEDVLFIHSCFSLYACQRGATGDIV